MPTKPILVTGANGFIGRHLVKAMRAKGIDTVTLDLDGYQPAQAAQWEGIVHLAAVSRTKDGELDPVKCLETNIVEAARILKQPKAWVILASTIERPTNVYGLSKRFAEDYARIESLKHGFSLAILRFATVYGPGDNPDKLIPRLKRGEAHLPLTPGTLPLDHIRVDEAVREIMVRVEVLMRDPHIQALPVVLRTGRAHTVADLIALS